MLQLFQRLDSGVTELVEVPAPGPARGRVLVRTTRSLVSPGTERMLVAFGRAGWVGKALAQPERLRALLARARAEGVGEAFAAVRRRLAEPVALGYCQTGVVLDGGGTDFTPGERVVTNGPHAGAVSSPVALTVRVPAGVTDEQAAFAPLAAVALEGLALLAPVPGDRVAVMGLGLVGQLTAQLLRAMGCVPLGFDPDSTARALARRHGIEVCEEGDPVAAVMRWTEGKGAAGVIITASTASHAPVNDAARMCRFRGAVVLVGVVGLRLDRAAFYANEVSFRVSNSYGPRDRTGPGSASDHFARALAWIASGDLQVGSLIAGRVPLRDAPALYADLGASGGLGRLLVHPEPELARTVPLGPPKSEGAGVAVLGAGVFARAALLPALASCGESVSLRHVVSARGASARFLGAAHGAAFVGTDVAAALADPAVAAVFVAMRHADHAEAALAALRAGRHVWVEKPLALAVADVDAVVDEAAGRGLTLMVGFNRRFAPLAVRLHEALRDAAGPRHFRIDVAAGRLPAGHWALDPAEGGGRIVGEACHFVDLLRFLAGAPVKSWSVVSRARDGQDGGRFSFEFANGDRGILNYLTDAPQGAPKETVRAEGPGWSAEIVGWRSLRCEGLSVRGVRAMPWTRADKGHAAAVAAFLRAVRTGGPAPIPAEELREVSRLAVAMQG